MGVGIIVSGGAIGTVSIRANARQSGQRISTTVAFGDILLCSEISLRILDARVARETMPR
jgi:hypothetical protein